MDAYLSFKQEIEQAQEIILQAKSSQEIKDLLNKDNPKRNITQAALIGLVNQDIMKHFPLKEIERIENIPHRNPFSKERADEILKFASKMDNDFTRSILVNAAQKHDPYMIPKEARDNFEPELRSGTEDYYHDGKEYSLYTEINLSVNHSTLDHIKNYPNTVEKIFENVLPKIQQEKNMAAFEQINIGKSFLTPRNQIHEILGYKNRNDMKYVFDSGDHNERIMFIYDKNSLNSGFLVKLNQETNNALMIQVTGNNINKLSPLQGKYAFDHYPSLKLQNNERKANTPIDYVWKTPPSPQNNNSREIEIARKAGYVQGVCECVAAIGDDHTLGKKLLTEMNVNRDMAKKFANPETFKTLEQGIFAQKQEQNLEQTQSFKR